SPHRRIAASPHRRIAASPHRRIAASPHRRIAACFCDCACRVAFRLRSGTRKAAGGHCPPAACVLFGVSP
ncbi:hypothetical protein AB0B28_09450, partial [Glycomyces sp. NPDC046736]